MTRTLYFLISPKVILTSFRPSLTASMTELYARSLAITGSGSISEKRATQILTTTMM